MNRKTKGPGEQLVAILEEYSDGVDEMVDMLEELDILRTEIEDTMELLQENLDSARTRLSNCHLGIRRLPPVIFTERMDTGACVLPFEGSDT